MSEEQDKQRNTRKKENNRLLTKAAIIGVVAGLLGGGIAYGGLSAANLNSNVHHPRPAQAVATLVKPGQ